MDTVIEFDWMMKDKVYAHVRIDCNTKKVICNEFRSKIWEQFLGNKPHTIQSVYDALEARCVSRYREDIGQYLRYYELKTYNAYLLCRKTHGVSSQDFFWIKWAGENIIWDDIKIKR